jgi:hypothetical protein
MVARILIAVVGGFAITVGLLLGMTQATKNFKTMDPTRYFGIVDFVPAPQGRRVQPPPDAAAPPGRPSLQYDRSHEPAVPFERPSIEEATPAAPMPSPNIQQAEEQ